MKKHTLSILALTLGLALLAAPASAADYKIDNGHSMAVFKIKHLGVGHFWGILHHVTGTVSFDAAAPEKAKINIAIKSDSVFTADKKRDGHLKAPDFFNAKEFPVMSFKSTSVKGSGKALTVTGSLTIRGVSKTVTAKVAFIGQGKDPWGNMRAGWEAHLTIKRSEFGISYMPGGLGETVDLVLAVEGIQSK